MEQWSQLNMKVRTRAAVHDLPRPALSQRLSSGSIVVNRRKGLLLGLAVLLTSVAHSERLTARGSGQPRIFCFVARGIS